jgi:phage/plasmid-like protein (TIGR03299 family)
MAHEIDTTNGVSSFVSAREPAWHRLGTVLDHRFTAEEAMAAAHLGGWNVRKAPLTALTDDGIMEVPREYASIRTNPVTGRVDILGVVGESYTPIQNEAHAELLNTLVDESGAHFETAGALRGGRETFVTMKMPETMRLGPSGDALDVYLSALNSHDGRSAFRFLVTPVRIVCANTQEAAIGAAKASFSIRHTVNAPNLVGEARDAMGLTFAYVDAFEREAEAMIARTLQDAELAAFADRLFRVNDAPSARIEKARRLHAVEVLRLGRHSETLGDVKGTAWGAYQAVTEYVDHVMPVRGGGVDQRDARAVRTLSGEGASTTKLRAFALLA